MPRLLHPDGVRPLGATILVDAVVAVLLAALDLLVEGMQVDEAAQAISVDLGTVRPLAVVLIVAAHVPLLWRQRSPIAVLVAVGAVRAVAAAFGMSPGWLGLLATLYAAGAAYPLPVSAAALGSVGAFEYLLYELTTDGQTMLQRLQTVVVSASVLAVPWALGLWSRIRSELRIEGERRRAQQRAEQARSAVADERERMARELHDILAHSISVMVLQASGGREVLAADRARAAVALEQIEATGRQSLVEVRRLLGLLHDETAEQRPPSEPGLARIEALAREVSEAGVPVVVNVDGKPIPLPPSIDLAAYRIVQEALTNVLKHAPGAATRIGLAYRDGVLDVEVIDSGETLVATRPARLGRGLAGMHERVSLVGGQLEAGPGPERGFSVRATLPVVPAERGA